MNMKKLFALLTAALLSTAAFAQSGKSVYMKYSDANDVSAVYISPAMFKMMGKLPDMKMDDKDINLSSIVKTMSGLYIIDSENAGINNSIRKDVEKFITRGDYEIMMEAKDNGESMRIYTMGDEKVVRSFVLLAYEENECSFICLEGEMPREALEKILSE